MTTAATLTSLLEAFLAEPGSDALAVLADGCEEYGWREESGWLRTLRVESSVGHECEGLEAPVWEVKLWAVTTSDGGRLTRGFRKGEEAWKRLARIVEGRLTDRCPSTTNDAKSCPLCGGRFWLLKGELQKCCACGGSGGVDWVDDLPPVPCSDCGGRGWVLKG